MVCDERMVASWASSLVVASDSQAADAAGWDVVRCCLSPSSVPEDSRGRCGLSYDSMKEAWEIEQPHLAVLRGREETQRMMAGFMCCVRSLKLSLRSAKRD